MAAQSCPWSKAVGSSLRTRSGHGRKVPQEQGLCWCYPLLWLQSFPRGLAQKGAQLISAGWGEDFRNQHIFKQCIKILFPSLTGTSGQKMQITQNNR